MKVYLDNCCYNRPYDDLDDLPVSLESQANNNIRRERFDYTKWQQKHFNDIDLETFVTNAASYAKSIGK